jgi:carboxypeptidase family protein
MRLPFLLAASIVFGGLDVNSSCVAQAAETTAIIVGRVLSATGAPVAGAEVSAASASGRYQAGSDASGRFTLVAVTPDTYVLSATARGYEPRELHGISALPGGRVDVDLVLKPMLREIGHVTRGAVQPFAVGEPRDTYTVTGEQARGPASASGSGLATYLRGTVQGAIGPVPGVQQDQFANVIVRGGKVDDVVFSYDAVPVPQALIAEPGGNVIGAQLATTGVGYTALTTGGFATGSDDALAATVDQTPLVGGYPARSMFSTGLGIVTGARGAEVERLWATPTLRQRYAIDAMVGSESIAYGDGRTFYPAEAATYGLSLSSRATWSISANAHLHVGKRDDLELLTLAGEATYDQYGSPFTDQRYGAFDGQTLAFPTAHPPDALVRTPSRIRGTYAIEKVQLLRSFDHAYARLRIYRSQYGALTEAPFFDDLSFPNGAISYFGRQGGDLYGAGFDVKSVASERHQLAYGVEVRRQTSALDQLVPTLDEAITSNPVLFSQLAYVADTWTSSHRLTLQGALRFNATQVELSTGPSYGLASLDPHVAAALRVGTKDALRAAFDHTTVAPKPLEVERNGGTVQNAPFVSLAPERGDTYELSYERGGRTRLRVTLFSKDERDRIDVIPTNHRVGVPQNVGALIANGIEAALDRGALSVAATYVRARSSSASQFGYNNLNAPAIAANHLFPVGYVPDQSAVASYKLRFGHVDLVPALSWESGYPYGNGRAAWIYDAKSGQPIEVRNDNHVNPGYNYDFLRDPSRPYDPATNPIVASLGTPEGKDPNTLHSAPLLLASLHLETVLTPRFALLLDVANVLGSATPTQLQGNPYLIGPPGYRGDNPLYTGWYGQQLGSSRPYTLGNGVPTNDGATPILPWTYGTGAYVPSSYPEARSIYASLRYRT